MKRNFSFKLYALIALAILIVLSSSQQLKLDKKRNQLGINDVEDIKDSSPSVVFTTVALGSFRGFIANLLFIRSQRMQEERRYYEVHQLARWIRTLQPRFTDSIAFMAWNMAYNISVTCDTPEERWFWVRKGIEMYIDGMKSHSSDAAFFWELGWIYQHKMGMNLDDANRYYKQQWALAMMSLLSENPDFEKLTTVTRNPAILNAKLSKLGYGEFLQLLAMQKMTYQNLVDAVMSTPNKNELPANITHYLKEKKHQDEVVKFIRQGELNRFDAETLFYLLEDVIDLQSLFKEVNKDWDFKEFERQFQELGRIPYALSDKIILPAKSKEQVLEIIDNFMRDRWAWNVYRLDTRKMKKLSEEFGWLDWRVSETHAIYWAKIGLEKDPKHIPCLRMVSQALKDIVDRGKLLYFSSETHKSIDWTYNIGIVEKASEIFENEINNLPENDRKTFITAYEYFLIDCVVALYINNEKSKANQFYYKLKERQPTNPVYQKQLERFVMEELTDDLESMNEDQIRYAVNGFLNTSLQMLFYNDQVLAKTYWDLAYKIHENYGLRTQNRKDRVYLQPFSTMATITIDLYKKNFPKNAAGIDSFYTPLLRLLPKVEEKKDNQNK